MADPNILELSEPSEVMMDDQWYEIATSEHFWIKWRFDVLLRHRKLLPERTSPVLEIGCGSGVFRDQLEKHIFNVVDGCDLNLRALKLANPGRGKLLLYNVYERRSELQGRYQAIFLMDVIEHIEDDLGFVEACISHASPNATIIVNVPWGSWLYGEYDRQVGHLRRYEQSSLLNVLSKSGLEVIKITPWGFSLVPLLLLRNMRNRFQDPAEIIRRGMMPPNKAFHNCLDTMRQIANTLPFSSPVGSSLMAFAKVKG